MTTWNPHKTQTKAKAWRRAAEIVERVAQANLERGKASPADEEVYHHIVDAVAPSLRRRAAIIERR